MPSNYDEINGQIDPEEVAAAAIEKISDLYRDKIHFIQELIQNADDVGSATLTFQIDADGITVWNKGRSFNKNDITAICSVGNSLKDLTQIGTHGIGFKAVYLWTDEPEIYSQQERFRIVGYMHPREIALPPEKTQNLVDQGCTVFHLPFKSTIGNEDVAGLAEKFGNIPPWSLLFLRDLGEVLWSDAEGVLQAALLRRPQAHPQFPKERATVVDVTRPGADPETFLVLRASVTPPSDVITAMKVDARHERDRQRIEKSRYKAQPVEIAFALEDGKIKPRPSSVLFSYLPTEVGTGLQFLIQARFQTTPARESIAASERSPWNKWLIEETASLAAGVLPELRDAGLLTPSLLETLPNASDVVPQQSVTEVFEPIREKILDTLRNKALIPTEGGRHGRPGNVFYPHSRDLVSLFTAKELTGAEEAAWLHPEVQWGQVQSGTQGRSGALVRDVGVVEWTAHRTVAWLREQSREWFASRDAEWLSRLYAYLSKHSREWEALFGVPLLRVASGAHVCPSNGVHFYPAEPGEDSEWLRPYLKKLPILSAPPPATPEGRAVRDMFERLGVRELRPAVFIEKWLLRCHRQDPALKDKKRTLHLHLRLIVRVWDRLTPSDRQRLLPELKASLWLHTYPIENPGAGAARRVADGNLYLPSAYTGDTHLESYFAHTPGTLFLDPGYITREVGADALLRVLKDMGVADLPQRRVAATYLIPAEERKELRNYHEEENWDLDGLPAALASLTGKEVPLEEGSVLWHVLCRLRKSHPPEFFLGRYTYRRKSARSDDEKTEPASFTQSLRDINWLLDVDGAGCAPARLCLSTPRNRQLLGGTVRYLHPAFDLRDTPDNASARQVASLLGIRLEPNLQTVCQHLTALRGKPAEVDTVLPIYQFLEGESATLVAIWLQGGAWVFMPAPKPHWHKPERVFWKDESALFGNSFGYLARDYPQSLKRFFSIHGVDEKARFAHCATAVRDAAQAGNVDEATRSRMYNLYERLCRDAEDGLESGEQAEWEELRRGPFWLGKRREEWGYHRISDLSRANQEYKAALMRDVVPFWSPPHPKPLIAEALGIEPCSEARTLFRPRGTCEVLEVWTSLLRSFSGHIWQFLNSETLNEGRRPGVSLDMLNRLQVCRTEAADVEYELKGQTVPDPRGLPTFLDPSSDTIWLCSDNEHRYPDMIGEALQAYIGTARLDAFVRELLAAGDETVVDEVIAAWRQKGLNAATWERTASNAQEPEDRQAAEEGKIRGGADTPFDGSSGDSLLDAVADQGDRRDVVADQIDQGDAGGLGAHDIGTEILPSPTADDHEATPEVIIFPAEQTIRQWPYPTREGRHDGHWSTGNGGGSPRPQEGDVSHGPQGHGGGGGSGSESPEHESLKDLIARMPTLLGKGLKLKQTEYPFLSLDRVDVLLETPDGEPVTVEVEAAIRPGSYVGIWQAVKYQHLAAVQYGLDCKSVRTILVAPHFPDDVKAACRKHGVEWFTQAIPKPMTS